MPETISPQPLSQAQEQEAILYRNQANGAVRNIETRGIKLAAAEKFGTLAVTEHDKALEGHQEELAYWNTRAGEHVDANLGAYIETAKRDAEAAGHVVDSQRPNPPAES